MKLNELLEKKLFSKNFARAKEVDGWKVTNRDAKRNLITYDKDSGDVAVTFGETGYVAANPKKQYDHIESGDSTNIKEVLGRL